jgi:hypothetical protein
MATRPLRAVQAGEAPLKRARRLTVTQAARGGNRRELLVALRTRIAQTVDGPDTPPRDLAALSRRLLEIAKEIEAIDAEVGDDDIGAAAATPDEEWAST